MLAIVTDYINYIQSCSNQACNYFLLSQNGKQIPKLTEIFSCIVYKVLGKYINPTRYCQIAKTESIEKEDISEEANLLADQKKTSADDKIHFQKHKSEDILAKAKKAG